jgi:hypothetical protein
MQQLNRKQGTHDMQYTGLTLKNWVSPAGPENFKIGAGWPPY